MIQKTASIVGMWMQPGPTFVKPVMLQFNLCGFLLALDPGYSCFLVLNKYVEHEYRLFIALSCC